MTQDKDTLAVCDNPRCGGETTVGELTNVEHPIMGVIGVCPQCEPLFTPTQEGEGE